MINKISKALKNLVRNKRGEDEDQEYFCVEDTFLSSDIKIEVENVGKLKFPLSEETVEKLIEVSSQAIFGRDEETVLDTDVRDIKMIPASKLDVNINEEALSNALEWVGCRLNINQSGKLLPHLNNMLIYSKGQFLKMHRDSPKEENVVAVLLIVLPSPHKGGDLIIRQNNKQHLFFGPKNPNIVKCVAFYSDCQREIRKVTEGFRVVLTYNVVLKTSSQIASGIALDECLNNAVNSYFSQYDSSDKLVYLLNNSYSQNNLKWDLLKGTDQNTALSLYVVAKNQNRVPCLALARVKMDICEEYEESDDEESDDYEIISTELYFWINDQNKKIFKKRIYVNNYDICYTMEPKELFESCETEQSGPTANVGKTGDNWHLRACVVIWYSKWRFFTGYNEALNELHKLTRSPGNENSIIEEIEKAGQDLYNKQFWKNTETAKKLIDIAIYINEPKKTIQILSEVAKELLDKKNIGRLLQLEKRLDRKTWDEVFSSWDKNFYRTQLTTGNALKIVGKYMAHPKKIDDSVIVDYLLQKAINNIVGSSSSKTTKAYSYVKTDDSVIEQLFNLLQVCSDLRKTQLQEKLIKYITTSDVFTPVSVAELFFRLKEKFNQNQFPFLKVMKYVALGKVTSQIPDLTYCSNNWYFDIKMPCSCEFCVPIQEFFHSTTQRRIVVPSEEGNKQHLYSHLRPLTSYPIEYHSERTENSLEITIEKDWNVLQEREKMLRNLLEFKEKLDKADVDNENREMKTSSTNETPQYSSDLREQVDNGTENGETPVKRSRLDHE